LVLNIDEPNHIEKRLIIHQVNIQGNTWKFGQGAPAQIGKVVESYGFDNLASVPFRHCGITFQKRLEN